MNAYTGIQEADTEGISVSVMLLDQAMQLLHTNQSQNGHDKMTRPIPFGQAEHLLLHAMEACPEDNLTFKALIRNTFKEAARAQFNVERQNSLDAVTRKEHAETRPEKSEESAFAKNMMTSTGGVGLNGIVGLDNIKKCLRLTKRLLTTADCLKTLDERGVKFKTHILLVGPPGNGKTAILYAYHEEMPGSTLIELGPTDILSKYYGEAERNLNEAMEVATRNTPAILFIDEIEGIFRSRDGSPGSSNSSMLTQLLIMMNKVQGVQIIGCTNQPWDLDPALLRRFGNIFYVPLPSEKDRQELLKFYEKKFDCVSNETTVAKVAAKTERFSGSDIKKLVGRAVDEVLLASQNRCNKDQNKPQTLKLVLATSLELEHYLTALRSVKASTPAAEGTNSSTGRKSTSQKMKEFVEQYAKDAKIEETPRKQCQKCGRELVAKKQETKGEKKEHGQRNNRSYHTWGQPRATQTKGIPQEYFEVCRE